MTENQNGTSESLDTPSQPDALDQPDVRRPRPRPSATSRARRVAPTAPSELGLGAPHAAAPVPTTPEEQEPQTDALTSPAVSGATSGNDSLAGEQAPSDLPAEPADALAAAQREPEQHEELAPEPAAPAAVSRAVTRTPAPLAVVVALATAAVLLALGCMFLARYSGKSGSTADRDQALAAAKSYTGLVLSYDYRHAAADRDKTIPHLTGKFRDDYKKSMDEVIIPKAPGLKAVVEGQIESAGIESISKTGKQIVTIVFGQQKVSNTATKQPRSDPYRLRVTLDRVGGEWKISAIVAL